MMVAFITDIEHADWIVCCHWCVGSLEILNK